MSPRRADFRWRSAARTQAGAPVHRRSPRPRSRLLSSPSVPQLESRLERRQQKTDALERDGSSLALAPGRDHARGAAAEARPAHAHDRRGDRHPGDAASASRDSARAPRLARTRRDLRLAAATTSVDAELALTAAAAGRATPDDDTVARAREAGPGRTPLLYRARRPGWSSSRSDSTRWRRPCRLIRAQILIAGCSRCCSRLRSGTSRRSALARRVKRLERRPARSRPATSPSPSRSTPTTSWASSRGPSTRCSSGSRASTPRAQGVHRERVARAAHADLLPGRVRRAAAGRGARRGDPRRVPDDDARAGRPPAEARRRPARPVAARRRLDRPRAEAGRPGRARPRGGR